MNVCNPLSIGSNALDIDVLIVSNLKNCGTVQDINLYVKYKTVLVLKNTLIPQRKYKF